MARAAIVRRLCGLSGGLLLVVRLLLGRLDSMRMLGLHGSVLLLLLVMLMLRGGMDRRLCGGLLCRHTVLLMMMLMRGGGALGGGRLCLRRLSGRLGLGLRLLGLSRRGRRDHRRRLLHRRGTAPSSLSSLGSGGGRA